jgi:TonB-dependent receptor
VRHHPQRPPSHTLGHLLTPVALACLASAATAQSAPEAPTETITITGIKSSNTRTIAAKQDSVQALDTIAADQIGKLPDFNVGDALKRVTGVNTLSYQGEPRFVIVRGLNANYNATLIDGFAFAASDIGSRQVLMEVLPSNFASSIDVTKSLLPETDGGGIGGVVNIVSSNAFSLPDGGLTLSAKLGQNFSGSAYGGTEPIGEASAKWAKRFGANNEFGFVGAASYWSRHLHVPQLEAGGTLNWYENDGQRATTAYGGNGFAVPTERRWYNYDNQRDRSGLTARLDWQPEGLLSGHVSAYWFKQHEDSDRNTQTASVDPTSTVSNQTATSGTLSTVNQLVELGRLRWDRSLSGINGELAADFAPGWRAELRGSVSRATVSNPQTWDRFTQLGMPFNYDWRDLAPTFTAVNATGAADPALYGLTYHREEATEYAQRVQDLQLNLRYNMESDSRGVGAALGARHVATRMDTSFVRTSYSGMPYTLADAAGRGRLCAFNCNTDLLLIDPGRADAAYAANAASATPTVDVAAQFGGTYAVNENVNAVFAQGQYRTDGWLVAGGLRLEETRFDTNGYRSSNDVWSPVSAERSYRKVLPSVLGVIDTSPASKLRLGVSQSLGRPRFDQLATRGGVLNTTTSPPTLSQGNPDLKPRRSTNVDIGHDWYLDRGRGIVSVALFHKIISDEIFTYGQTQTLDINGVPTPVLVTQARNVADKVKLSGIEFGLTKDLDDVVPALKGFGVSANATFVHAKYPVTLSDGSSTELSLMPQQPRRIWNLTLYYELGATHARLAWNHVGSLWDDRYPNYTPDGFYANRYQQATDNVDLQLSYDISKKASVSLDLLNITSQGQQYNFGRSQEYLQSAWKLGPSVLLGFSYTL